MEQQRPRVRSASPPSTDDATRTEDFVPCTSCGERTQRIDLYQTAEGEVCSLCHAETDADDTRNRGARDLAMTTLFSPGYVALAVAICVPFFTFLGVPGAVVALIPALCMGIGANAIRTAIQLGEANPSDRARLAFAGVWSMSVLGLLAAFMAGLI